MSQDNTIVVFWFYGVKNWMYVVLARVRTLSRLYFFRPLYPNEYHKQDKKLASQEKYFNKISQSKTTFVD